jgi:hypothetical protein
MEFHVSVFRPGRMAGATDFPGVRRLRPPAGAASSPSEHRTTIRRCAAQAHFSAHCAAQAHLSRCRLGVPRLPDRVSNDSFNDVAIAAARVTEVTHLLVFHKHGVPAFGPSIALHHPGCAAAAASPKRNPRSMFECRRSLAPGTGGGRRREEAPCKSGPSARRPPSTSKTSPT